MKLKGSENIFCYIRQDKSMILKTYHDKDIWDGVCITPLNEGIPITFEVDVPMPDNPTHEVMEFFDKRRSEIRAKAQLDLEMMDREMNKYMAIESQ